MNYTELIDIIERLKTVEPKKAKKLAKQLYKCLCETDTVKLHQAEKRLNESVFYVFISLIDEKSAYTILHLGLGIKEQEHLIEQETGNGWKVYQDGCYKYGKVNDEVKVVGEIPRYYQAGYVVPVDATDDVRVFYEENKDKLKILSEDIDRHQKCLTFDYKVRDLSVPRDLTEQMIDYLGLSRVIKKEYLESMQMKKEF